MIDATHQPPIKEKTGKANKFISVTHWRLSMSASDETAC